MQLKNTQKVELTVEMKGGDNVAFQPGETKDVDSKFNWQDNCFVKAGWLVEVEQPKPAVNTSKRKNKAD